MSSHETKNPQDAIDSSTPARGRLPAEMRAQIFDLSAEGFTPEEIAHKVGRSVAAVRKVLAVEEPAQEGLISKVDLDQVIEFLAELPEEATQEILQLAQLQRERTQLRSSLEMRLKDMKKKV
ncbi:helix-turn-helix domain-containing protein [bacterium]|nr:helix-turn-helix domain-containing protein [bacterium]